MDMRLKYNLHSIAVLLLFGQCIYQEVSAFSSSTTSSTSSIVNTAINRRSNASKEPTLLKWLIVGGGPHGVHIATSLLNKIPSLSHYNLQIIDEQPKLLYKWKTRTAATGMSYLRSSANYHLDVKEDGLKQFSNQSRTTHNPSKSKRRKSKTDKHDPLFAADYHRPKLDFFNQHCDHVIEKNQLEKLHFQGKVIDIILKETHVEVEIQQPDGYIYISHAENIVLALGSDGPACPDWATKLMTDSGKVKHIFADSNKNISLDAQKSITIVGGGISAAHLALKLDRERTQCIIHILCRHELREQQFDTHQDWMMDRSASKRSKAGGGQGIPKCQLRFASLNSFVERRNVIKNERQAGTISPSVSRGKGGLRYAIEGGRIHWHEGDVHSVSEVERSGQLAISTCAGETIVADEIILATGFGKYPPCADLIQSIAARNNLTLCPCGYPAPDFNLRWHERIFLAGALAELELGPSARNIAGARLASERIVAAATTNNNDSLSGDVV